MAEHSVGAVNNFLQNGEMRRLELEETGVIVARVSDEYFAFGANCSHYYANLTDGLLNGHCIMCPLHHAMFDIRTGARLEPPAMNDIAHYPVKIEDGQVMVTLPNDNERVPQGKTDPSADARTFVIVGGGAAGATAAEELRRQNYQGRVVLVNADPNPPVDRPNLSKDYLDGHAKPEWIPLRGESWYAERDIELKLGMSVTSIDPAAHTITLDNSDSVQYNKLLLATGGTPRRLGDADLEGVFTLRSLDDASCIIDAATEGSRAIIIGASFIGMEAAASLASGRGVDVTVVGIESMPFERVMGPEVGALFQKAHEENGVQFRLETGFSKFVSDDGKVTGVELDTGEVLEADFVVMGVGIKPATDFLSNSGLTLDKNDGSVVVNVQLQTSDTDIFAAGDIARYDGHRVEHWRAAQQQGMVAARNMLGGTEPLTPHVPFFWTVQWGIPLRYVGHAYEWDDIIYRGHPADGAFIAFYVQAGRLLAVAGIRHDREMDAIEFILRDNKPLTPEQMRDTSFDLVAYAISD